MKKHIIILAILAFTILILPFLIGDKIALLSEKPVETAAVIVSPEPMAETGIVEKCLPDASSTPTSIPTPMIMDPTDDPVIPNESPAKQQEHNSGISVPDGAAFVLTIRGKNITITPSVDEATLEKTPGWLSTSASPGEEGVCVVYGHRNRNHLKVLKDVTYGDAITVTMPDGNTFTYVIESMEIIESNEDLRIPTLSGQHLMLTTCYPFYYTGHAPKKYVIIAVIR